MGESAGEPSQCRPRGIAARVMGFGHPDLGTVGPGRKVQFGEERSNIAKMAPGTRHGRSKGHGRVINAGSYIFEEGMSTPRMRRRMP